MAHRAQENNSLTCYWFIVKDDKDTDKHAGGGGAWGKVRAKWRGASVPSLSILLSQHLHVFTNVGAPQTPPTGILQKLHHVSMIIY